MRVIPLILIVVIVCLTVATVGRCSREGDQDESTSFPVDVHTFPIEVRTHGELDSIQSTVLTSTVHTPEPRKVVKVVPDGTVVEKGEVLMNLDAAGFETRLHELNAEIEIQEAEVLANQKIVEAEELRQKLAVEKARLDLQIVEAALDKTISGDGPKEMTKLKRAVDKAFDKLKKQATFYDDIVELEKEGFLSPKEIKEAKDKRKEKEDTHDDARLDYEHHLLHQYPYDKQVGSRRIELAKLDVEQASAVGKIALMKAMTQYQKGRLKFAQLKHEQEECVRNLAACEVRAPQAGTVVLAKEFFGGRKRKLRMGDAVFYGQPLAEIPDTGSMAVKTKMRERDIEKVMVGTGATVRCDAFPNLLLRGKVVSIGGVTEGEIPTEKALEITIALDGENPQLRPGMTAHCVLQGEGAEGVCAVPIQAVFHTHQGPYCYKKQGGKFRQVPVQLGKVGDDYVQVKSGLKKGDRIGLQSPPAHQLIQ